MAGAERGAAVLELLVAVLVLSLVLFLSFQSISLFSGQRAARRKAPAGGLSAAG